MQTGLSVLIETLQRWDSAVLCAPAPGGDRTPRSAWGRGGGCRNLEGAAWRELGPPTVTTRVGRGMNTPPHWLDLTTSLFSASPRAPVV